MLDTYTGRSLAMDKNPIYLGGSIDLVNHCTAAETITPGMEVEYFGLKLRPARQRTGMFALAKWGRDVETVYPVGDLVYGAVFQPGSRVWAVTVTLPDSSPDQIIPSTYLEPNGDGRLKLSPRASTSRFYQAMARVEYSFRTDRLTGAMVWGTVPRVETLVLGN